MAGARDIEGWFLILRHKADMLAGADLQDADRAQVKELAEIVLRLSESVVLDLNRIADELETLARTDIERFQREINR